MNMKKTQLHIKKQMTSYQMKSLFEFLGRPAGPELGNKVYLEALKQKVTISNRIVKTKRYEGEVKIYPTYFLEMYFKNNK